MPKDETIKKWIKSKGKKNFEEDMKRRLDILEKKKSKIKYILKRLKKI